MILEASKALIAQVVAQTSVVESGNAAVTEPVITGA